MSALLEVNNLQTCFVKKKQAITVVDGVSFKINKGETVALVGESGSGKSITSLSIMGLLPKQTGRIANGEILLEGVDLTKLPETKLQSIRGNDISMIFQEPMTSLNPVYTIGNQISEVLVRHNKSLSKKEAAQQSIKMLKLVGFPRAEDIINEYPHQLSGGMRQRVMIAMAMANNPKLLIADEPTTALDVTIQAQILDLMRDVAQKFDTSILLITHDLGVVAEMAQRVLVMYCGQIVEEATVTEIFANPKHPYTVGLLGSIPKLTDDLERLVSIPGVVPPPTDFPIGCRFAPRCEHAMEKCHQSAPELQPLTPGHKVRCYLYD